MNNLQYISENKKIPQLSLTSLLTEIQKNQLGVKLINMLLHNFITKIGSSVYIKNAVEFLNATSIEIWNISYIYHGFGIDGRGYKNNYICLENGVILSRNINIDSLENTCLEISQDTFIGSDVCIASPGNIIMIIQSSSNFSA